MYGLIGQIEAMPGRRADLIALLSGMDDLPGCVSYVVAEDLVDDDVLWVTETWVDADHHVASLQMPEVRQMIEAGRPLIGGFGHRFATRPVAGFDRPA